MNDGLCITTYDFVFVVKSPLFDYVPSDGKGRYYNIVTQC